MSLYAAAFHYALSCFLTKHKSTGHLVRGRRCLSFVLGQRSGTSADVGVVDRVEYGWISAVAWLYHLYEL